MEIKYSETGDLFVYGTLLKELNTKMHRILARNSLKCEQAFMLGKLYDIGGYPGVIESDNPADRVLGEIYSLKNPHAVLLILDKYEQCTKGFSAPHEYVRKRLPIRKINDEELVMAWVYVFNRDISALKRIESGDYRDYTGSHPSERQAQ